MGWAGGVGWAGWAWGWVGWGTRYPGWALTHRHSSLINNMHSCKRHVAFGGDWWVVQVVIKASTFLSLNDFMSSQRKYENLVGICWSLSDTLIVLYQFSLHFNRFCYFIITFFLLKMVPRFNADEFHRIVVENEFVTNAHVEENAILQNKNSLTNKYLRNQKESLKFWTM